MVTEPPRTPAVSLEKSPESAPASPGWITLPARVIALVVVLPVRLVYDLVLAAARGLMRAPGKAGRWIRDTLLRPLAAALGRLFDTLVIRPLRWLATVVILGALKLAGRGTGKLARWIYRVLLAPTGRAVTWFFRTVVLAPLRLLASGIAYVAGLLATGIGWLFTTLIAAPLRLLGMGLMAVGRVLAGGLSYVASGIGWLFTTLVVAPLRLLGAGLLAVGRVLALGVSYVLGGIAWVVTTLLVSPLVWLAGWTWRILVAVLGPPLRLVWTVVSTTWLGTIAALGWAWHSTGQLLRLLFRLLILTPANMVWVYALRPVVQGVAWAWHLLGRCLRWVGTTFILPPAKAVQQAWRTYVRAPVRQARLAIRATMLQTRQEVRRHLRAAFRRAG